MKMVSMKTEGEAEAVTVAYDCCPCIYLNDDQVEALGITGMPAPGTVFMLQARAVVTRMTAEGEETDEGEGSKPDVSLSLSLTDMGMQPAGGPSAAAVLYGE